jgi:hypothetical protein
MHNIQHGPLLVHSLKLSGTLTIHCSLSSGIHSFVSKRCAVHCWVLVFTLIIICLKLCIAGVFRIERFRAVSRDEISEH